MTYPDQYQWEAATRVILSIVRLQAEQPGVISLKDLSDRLQLAAHERDLRGDFGAAQLLEKWAKTLGRPEEDEVDR